MHRGFSTLNDQVETIDCIRIRNKTHSKETETVATESKLALYVDNEFLTEFQYSVGLEESMVLGHLLSSGRISNKEDIYAIRINGQECRINLAKERTILPDKIEHQKSVSFDKLLEIKTILLENQKNHRATRGFHGAILYDLSTDRSFTCEDIGRHNAVDKVIGYGLNEDFALNDSVLLLSGRLLSNIVSKGIFSKIPVIASMTVSSREGIQKAKEHNYTLLGCLSNDGCWLYNEGVTRVVLQE